MLFDRLFGRNRITLNKVRDTVYAAEGDETLELYVDDDAMALARRIRRCLEDIEEAKLDPEKISGAAIRFSEAILGAEQTGKLIEFYHGNTLSVFEWTSKYFTARLSKKITKAQKNAKII